MSCFHRIPLVVVIVMVAAISGCGGSTSPLDSGSTNQSLSAAQDPSSQAEAQSTDQPAVVVDLDPVSPLAELVEPLPSAIPTPDETTPLPAIQPVSLTINDLRINKAKIIPVGVRPEGDMEVPPPKEVGWYRYGAEPGKPGSVVLAGHIASGGVNGAFYQLDQIEVGAVVTVELEDGLARDYQVVELARFKKDQLPFNQVFAKDGPSRLFLITCGGSFDLNARSYEDNVVAIAVPIDERQLETSS